MIEVHDTLMIHCPQLGGDIPFRYCRTMNETLPCRRIIVCWEFRFEISKFLSEHYSAGQVQKALAPPSRTRIEAILQIIEEVKENKKGDEE